MSSSVFETKKTATPKSKRRAPVSNENAQPTQNKRSLSDRIRNLFGRDSSAKSRTASNDRRQPSPIRSTVAAESPRFRTPTVPWPAKKTSKKNSDPPRPMEISSPINPYPSTIRGETFVPRTPELGYASNERPQSTSSYSRRTPTNGFREQQTIIDDRPRQVNLPDLDAFPPPSYTSDRSRSPSMTYARPTQPEADYYFYNERQSRSTGAPMSDVEVLSTPQRRRVNEVYSTTQNYSSRPPLATSTNSLQHRSSSSSTLNNAEMRSSTILAKDSDSTKLKPPSSPFGSTSNKKKEKKSKTKTTTTSSTTVSQLLEQNPLDANRSRTSIYGSLPDAEVIYDGTANSIRQSRYSDNKYPYISAIVEHHMRPTTVRLPERPIVPTTGTISTVTNTGTNVQRPARFDTSTTTLDDHEQRPYWSDSHGQGPAVQPRPDGYIRPVTPDAGVVRIGLNISTNGHAEPPESPTIYRSSTTIYTRDKNQWVEHDDGRTTYVEKKSPPVERREDPIVIPPKIRYTPPIKRDEHLDEDNIVQEEHYEVSYQYERQVEEYSYESNLNQRYTDDIEREHSYQHSPRSFIDQREEHFRQETRNPITPTYYAKASPQTYALTRADGFDGLGILVATDAETRSQHFIREVEPGSPGYRAGLRKNDRIISVNNISTENMDFSNVLLLIKQGLDNNHLHITVIHELDSI